MSDSPSELQNEIDKLERKHSENPEGRYFVPLANAYRKSGDIERAEDLLREGLELHPEYMSAHIVLGRCLADRGASREAAEEFRYVLSVDPQNLVALRTLGSLAAAEGDHEEAERWYGELLAVDPMNEEARTALDSLAAASSTPPDPSSEDAPEADAGEMSSGEVEPLPLMGDGGLDDAYRGYTEGDPANDISLTGTGEWDDTDEAARADEELPLVAAEPAAGDAEPFDADAFYGGNIDLAEPPPEAGDTELPTYLDAEPEADRGHDEDDEDEVVTETIADLYARQGFYDRAAAVYRELHRRGGPEHLLDRAEEMERLAAEDAADEPTSVLEDRRGGDVPDAVARPADAPEPGPEGQVDASEPALAGGLGGGDLLLAHPEEHAHAGPGAGGADTYESEPEDAFTSSFVNGFGGTGPESASDADDEVAPLPPSAAPVELEGATAASHTAGEYLREMLSWRPAPSTDTAAAQPRPAGGVESEEIESPYVAPVAEEAPDPVPSAEPSTSSSAALEPGAVTEEEDLLPWELPSSEGDAPEPAPTEMTEDPWSAPEAEAAEVADEPLPTPVTPAPAQPAPAPGAEEGHQPAEDEEDLESFQAWLRSLKR